MRPSLKNLPKRTAEKARTAAAGSPVPAGQEAPDAEAAATPITAERGAMRKRVRRLSRTREVLLREMGALVVEMRRLERDNPELIARKAAELLAIDEEMRGLREALGERQTVEQVVAAGVAGSCARCGTLRATDDRFCPRCGLAVAEVEAAEVAAAAPEGVEPGQAEPEIAAAPAADGKPETTPAPAADGKPEATPAADGKPLADAKPEADAAPQPGATQPPPPPPPPPPPADRSTSALSASAPPQP
jgi:hypothetical protein